MSPCVRLGKSFNAPMTVRHCPVSGAIASDAGAMGGARSHRGRGVSGDRRLTGGWGRNRGRQPTPSAGVCQSEWQTGEDRPTRCGGTGPVCRSHAPPVRSLPDEQVQPWSEVVMQQRQLVELLTAALNRLAALPGPMRQNVECHIEWLKHQLNVLDGDLRQRLAQTPAWFATVNLLKSVPGVGPSRPVCWWRTCPNWAP